MQTFLPWPDFTASAACLDSARLGKQIVEGYQVMRCLTGDGSRGWGSHPVVSGWRGCEGALMSYLDAMHTDWQRRRDDDAQHKAHTHCRDLFSSQRITASEPPWWLGSPGFHLSHQLNLARKDDAYRATFSIPSSVHVGNEPYLWPASPGFFQVATRGNGVGYASWFGSGQVTGKRLVVSASEADQRAESLFPRWPGSR
jgi:Pyrimidine dimer DNA glycosylase